MPACLRLRIVLFQLFLVSVSASLPASDGEKPASAQAIRCAVIGGMMDTGFWPELAKRFERSTGHQVEVVAKGPKHAIVHTFVQGEADLITMHASDIMINLVADGYGVDPQPWARNDLVIVGPSSDPAGIRGMTDAAGALRKLVQSKSVLLIQRSLGAEQVLFDLVKAHRIQLDWGRVIIKLDDPDRQMLKAASENQAYTLVGRIPFLNGKIPNYGLEAMVQGDPRLRRPYIVVTVSPGRTTAVRAAAARQLADFLRHPETQAWIAEFGRGTLDERPLFFPVKTVERQACEAR